MTSWAILKTRILPAEPAEAAPGEQGYQKMVLASYEVHWCYNVAAALSSWTLLAGFIVLPGTFTSLQNLRTNTEAVETLQSFAKRTGLICLSAVCCGMGAVGIILLWLMFRRNYLWSLWLLNHLFL